MSGTRSTDLEELGAATLRKRRLAEEAARGTENTRAAGHEAMRRSRSR